MAEHHIIDIHGPVHYVDHGGTGRPMVMVHGLGGSHLNWIAVADHFARNHHVLAVDLAGFGLTPLAGRSASVQANRELLDRFIAEMTDEPVVLVGNSMGGLIAMMEAADSPRLVSGLVLVNPALPAVSTAAINGDTLRRIVLPLVPVAGPAYMQRYYDRTTPEEQVEETLRIVCSDPGRVSEAHREVSLEMARMRRTMEWAIPAFSEASRSIAGVLGRRSRFRAMAHRISAPTLLIHGEDDRVVDPNAARWLASQRPDWGFLMLDGNGHVPQVETPELFVEVVEGWLDRTLAA